jgi:signal transduction histidine kinase/ActR/RegA family two-component response regulator
MLETLSRLFSQADFMPHGMCYLWQPGVLWLNVVADSLITLAYFSIPFTLLYFVRKRTDLQFNWMFVCFAIFIVACGTTHAMEILVVWHPAYWAAGAIKALTAAASVPTAILLVKLVPQALRLPSPQALEQANQELRREVADREQAQMAVRQLNERLEMRVAEAYENLRQTQVAVLQQERLRALGQMASGVAHDINNALSPAALYSQSLLEHETGLTPQGREYLEIVLRAIDDASHTVDRMREFSRSRDTRFVATTFQLGRIIKQVVNLTRARWLDMPQERGVVIRVETSIAPDLPPVMGSDSEVRDALTNLVLNAADAMPTGGTLTLRAYAQSPTRVRVEVCDTGVGMDEETRRKCLEPFFTTKGERGTGLGLAMVYGTVQRHGGDIEIASEPRKGTTVSLLLPIAEEPASVPEKPATTTRPQRSLRILVVDDDPLLLKLMRDTLEADGHRVVVADGGRAGVEAFLAAQKEGDPFAVVLSDLGMPYVDGRKVASAIKAASPGTPVVLVTGWGRQMHMENDLPPEVDRVLAKPPQLAELREVLASVTGT